MVLTLYRYNKGQFKWYADVEVKDRDEAIRFLLTIDSSELSWEIKEGGIEL